VQIQDIVFVAVAGLAGGFVNAIAGGGSLIVFPTLIGAGLSSVSANVTNSVGLWPGYAGNAATFGKAIRNQRSEVRVLIPVAFVGALIGCVALLALPVKAFDIVVPILVAAAALLVGLQPRLTRYVAAHTAAHPHITSVAIFGASVYGGFFGGGLGVILIAVLGLTTGQKVAELGALKGVLQLVIATVSLIVFAVAGPVHWGLAAVCAPTALLGGVLGARATQRIPEQAMRRAIVVLGLAVAVWLLVRAVT
jgi:uncharacterized membrane protein YfcA